MASNRAERRRMRQKRVRRRVMGSGARPRLAVCRSLHHVYAQVIADGRTLLAVSTLSPGVRDSLGNRRNVEAAKAVGKAIAQRCLQAGISRVVFDRNGFLYHGRVKALAEAAREAGLQF